MTLNDRQKEAVTAPVGPVLVVAGAGSGKTRVLASRIQYLVETGHDPRGILALTFTNKAAREMKERIGIDQIAAGTFHSICCRILRSHARLLGYDRGFEIADEETQKKVLRGVLDEMGINYSDAELSTTLAFISWEKNHLRTPDESDLYPVDREAYRAYQEALFRKGYMDFDDLLIKTVQLFDLYPDVLERYRKRFVHVLVDEYQDTNHAQYVLLRQLDGGSLFVVGDPDQSIYGFRGSDIQNILRFTEDRPDALVVRLEENYRSTRKILEISNRLIAHNAERLEKNLWTRNKSRNEPAYFILGDEREEAAWIVRQLAVLHSRHQWKDMAVLVRTNYMTRVFEEECLARRVPYRLVGGTTFFDRKEIRDILAYLRLILNHEDDVSLERIINVPRRGIGPATWGKLLAAGDHVFKTCADPPLKGQAREAVLAFHELISSFDPSDFSREWVRGVMKETGYLDFVEPERQDNLYEFLALVDEYSREDPEGGLQGFLQEASLMTDLDADGERDAVQLMTVHAAKGLEFPVVFVAGLNEDVFPHFRSLQEGAVEEERRLCYVAMTRAKEELFLTCTRYRWMRGSLERVEPSRFLPEALGDKFVNHPGLKSEA